MTSSCSHKLRIETDRFVKPKPDIQKHVTNTEVNLQISCLFIDFLNISLCLLIFLSCLFIHSFIHYTYHRVYLFWVGVGEVVWGWMLLGAVLLSDKTNRWPNTTWKTEITNINFTWIENVYVDISYLNTRVHITNMMWWKNGLEILHFNSYPPCAPYMRQSIGSALVQIMACRLFGAKPLSKPILGYCQLNPYRSKLQWDLNQNTKRFIHEMRMK